MENENTTPAQDTPAAIREWAAKNGYEVGARGRIASEVQDAYKASQAA